MPFENIVERENAGNQYFLISPQCFLPFPKQKLIFFFSQIYLLSANAFNLDQSEILSFVKALMFSFRVIKIQKWVIKS